MVVLGGGGFLMSEVSLQRLWISQESATDVLLDFTPIDHCTSPIFLILDLPPDSGGGMREPETQGGREAGKGGKTAEEEIQVVRYNV